MRNGAVRFIVFAILLPACMIACTSHSSTRSLGGTPTGTEAQPHKDPETIAIVDQNGRSVNIPKRIDRIVMLPFPFPALYFSVTGTSSKIAGIHPGAKSNMLKSMLGTLAPDLLNVPTGFVQGKELNVEELLKLHPDVIFFWGLYPKQLRQLEAVNVPAVAVFTIKSGNALDSIHLWIRMLGRIFSEGGKSDELIAHNLKTADMIYSRIKNIPKEKRPRALMIYNHGAKEIIIPGGNVYVQYWMEATGAVNVAEDVKGTAGVNMEQIYKWDPDIIYLGNFCDTYPPDLINNSFERQDWSLLRAVKEKRVYKVPSGIYRWDPPSADASLMLKWMAQIHYPALFKDYDMREEIVRHFSTFYNYDLTETQIEGILHPKRPKDNRYPK